MSRPAVRIHGAFDFERLVRGEVAHAVDSRKSGWWSCRPGAAEPELVQVLGVEVGRHGLHHLAVHEDVDGVLIDPDTASQE
ncbi:hypothetical protein G5C60_00600 [Streptomyces sp. HC44]|uniref:Uncharacterized protein n=1 Tax=Streptomyces scabichelini TaxID=2711217 RepID=A0A6G4UX00_9ACTN|nr:hypothetical protein [Streptomyces scabichelini]NGO06217.1 hypothetical protein [Streptomyces scabichelini]